MTTPAFPSTIFQINNQTVDLSSLLSPFGHQPVNNPDLFTISNQTGHSIDTVRQMINFLSLKPYQHSFKIGLIIEPEKLTLEAQNALLKTLEEPGDHNYIFILTSQPNRLLPTIISRCHFENISTSHPPVDQNSLLVPQKTIGENLLLSSKLPSTKETALLFLKNQQRYLHQQLLNHPNLQILQQLEKSIKAVLMIEANVAPTSAFDYYLLSS